MMNKENVHWNSRPNSHISGRSMNEKNSAIISLAELERIKDSCALINREDNWNQQKSHQRKTLFEKSKGRYQHWPNTLEALRRKKEEDRIKKLEEQEIARRKLDAEEDAFRITERNVIIDQANKKAFENQDRVKALKAKLMM